MIPKYIQKQNNETNNLKINNFFIDNFIEK